MVLLLTFSNFNHWLRLWGICKSMLNQDVSLVGTWPPQPQAAQPTGGRKLPTTTLPASQQCPFPAVHHRPAGVHGQGGQCFSRVGGLILRKWISRKGSCCQNSSHRLLLTAQRGCTVGQVHCSGGSSCLLLPVVFPTSLTPFPHCVAVRAPIKRQWRRKDGPGKDSGCNVSGLLLPSLQPVPCSLLEKREKRSQLLTRWVVFVVHKQFGHFHFIKYFVGYSSHLELSFETFNRRKQKTYLPKYIKINTLRFWLSFRIIP